MRTSFAPSPACPARDGDDESHTGYDNTYIWVTLESALSSSLFARTTLSVGRITHDRKGFGFFGDTSESEVEFTVRDDRSFDFLALKQDWNFDRSHVHYLKWGFDLRRLSAEYDYLTEQRLFSIDGEAVVHSRLDTTLAKLALDRYTLGAYAADRIRLSDPLTAEHTVLGFEHVFADNAHLRIEAYYKDLSSLRPDYRNWLNQIEIFPELQQDRLRLDLDGAVSRGLEVYLKRDGGGRFSWWASYALAEVEEEIRAVTAYGRQEPIGEKVPGRFDQRHTFYFDANFRPNSRWRLNLASWI